MFDIPVLHEQLHLGSLLGSIIVIAGLYLLLWGKNKEMKDCAAKVAQATEEIKDQEIQFQARGEVVHGVAVRLALSVDLHWLNPEG
ncbi:hypothetical protein RJ639_002897 [Escallonia herrerae]|uniref:Uncharacterized protein n=1 Tax=Escallonia herrerae TaxID=1293975 RepID=A0AA88W1M1_9ASTE|nr:hypothetical protein RJ639_002897 [Escallonia herrerae]